MNFQLLLDIIDSRMTWEDDYEDTIKNQFQLMIDSNPDELDCFLLDS